MNKSGYLVSQLSYNERLSGYEQVNLNYQYKGLEIFANSYVITNTHDESSTLEESFRGDRSIDIVQTAPTDYRSTMVSGTVGFNYDINDKHSVGRSSSMPPYIIIRVSHICVISISGTTKF